MWLCLNNAFISIVTKPGQPGHLLVRARRPGDLEAAFPGCIVERTPGRDYLYRTTLAREEVGRMVGAHAAGVTYPNFKNSVENEDLHDAYAATWGTMAKLQAVRPYGRDSAAAQATEARFLRDEGRDPVVPA